MKKGRHWLVIYDIPDDYLRTRVMRTLKDFGFERLQKSAYIIRAPRSRIEDVRILLDKIIGSQEADVRIFPLCKYCYNDRIVVRELYIIEEEVYIV